MDLHSIIPQEVHTYERTSGICIAEQDADIIIPGLSYRILIKKDRMYIDAQDFAEAVLYLNDERIVQQWVTIETV